MPDKYLKDSESSQEKTALVPKSFLGDKVEVGKTCKIRVTHVYEEEVEIEYVSDKSKDEKEPSEVDAKIDLMAEEQ